MSKSWKSKFRGILGDVQRTAYRAGVVIAIIVGIQIVVSLLAWLILFRRYPQGLSMGLTLVGFLSWFLSFFTSEMSGRTVAARTRVQMPYLPISVDQDEEPGFDSSGLGCLIFVAGTVPLAIAFVLRVQADLSAGKTWADIFPPMNSP